MRSRLSLLLPALAVVLAIACAVNVYVSVSARHDAAPLEDSPLLSAGTPPASWDPKYEGLTPFKALPTGLSYVAAFGLGLAIPAVWILALFASAVRWKAAAWRASRTKGGAPTWSGELGHRTVRGEVVAIDGGAEDAFLVVIEQRAQQVKGELVWKQTSRQQSARPFTLALSDGQRLRVEPDSDARLVDSLEAPVVIQEGVRERRVRLNLGEEVCVVGRIARGVDPSLGYRGGGEGRVLLPPQRGRMLMSTGALDQLFARRYRSARHWLLAWLYCLLLPCWLSYFPFWINALYGERTAATVMAKATETVKSEHHADFQTDVLTFRIDATGEHFADWVRPSAGWLEVGARVPVFYAPGWAAYARVGGTPTVDLKDGKDDGPIFSTFLVLALMAVFGFGRYIRTRPWWERPQLDEDAADALQPEPS